MDRQSPAHLELHRAGHGWQDINQFGSSFSTLTNAQKQWAIANYLLLKNNASWMYICGSQEYGTLLLTPEYNAPIGSPTAAYLRAKASTCETLRMGWRWSIRPPARATP